jgi:hypothetical protein
MKITALGRKETAHKSGARPPTSWACGLCQTTASHENAPLDVGVHEVSRKKSLGCGTGRFSNSARKFPLLTQHVRTVSNKTLLTMQSLKLSLSLFGEPSIYFGLDGWQP